MQFILTQIKGQRLFAEPVFLLRVPHKLSFFSFERNPFGIARKLFTLIT